MRPEPYHLITKKAIAARWEAVLLCVRSWGSSADQMKGMLRSCCPAAALKQPKHSCYCPSSPETHCWDGGCCLRCNPFVRLGLGVVCWKGGCMVVRCGRSEGRIEVVGGRRELIPWPSYAPV